MSARSSIDQLFGVAEAVVDGIEGVSRALPRRRPAPAAAPAAESGPRGASAGASSAPAGTAVARRPRPFRVVESIDAGDGRTVWVVTDGADRAECSSPEFARRVQVALG